MQTTVARQPIFDARKNTYAYELLFRSGFDNVFSFDDGDRASSSVISDGFFNIGVETLTGGRPAFINFTRDLILREYAHLLPKEILVVEILEDVEPDDDVLAACRELKKAGYTLALDDYEGRENAEPFLDIVDIVKVDFSLVRPEERTSIADRLNRLGIDALAEKVETNEEFEDACRDGYRYFQGYFFSRPVILDKRSIPESKLVKLQLLSEVNRGTIDFSKTAAVLTHDVALTYKFLRYINSAAFGLRNKVTNVEQAITLLGERNLRKWVSLVTLANMAEEKPTELVKQAAVRGKFCELLAPHAGHRRRENDLFMLGMFSLLDAITDRPMPELLADIVLEPDVSGALLGETTTFSPVYEAVLCFEKADWRGYGHLECALKLTDADVPQLYCQSVDWARQLIEES